jgi:hypothetical protein
MAARQESKKSIHHPEKHPHHARPEQSGGDLEYPPLASKPAATLDELPNHSTTRPLRQAAVLQMQLLGGNGYAQRALAQRRPDLLIQRVTLSNDDYAALADQLREAITRLVADDEAIYVALQKLQKDAAAIGKLKKAYQDKNKSDLEVDIRGRLGGEALRLALELINVKVDPKKAAMVGSAPSAEAEYKAAAGKLFAAMKGLGTQEEAIYAVLIPFDREAAKLQKLKDTYRR